MERSSYWDRRSFIGIKGFALPFSKLLQPDTPRGLLALLFWVLVTPPVRGTMEVEAPISSWPGPFLAISYSKIFSCSFSSPAGWGEACLHIFLWCLFPEEPGLEHFWKCDISIEASGLLSIHKLLHAHGYVSFPPQV